MPVFQSIKIDVDIWSQNRQINSLSHISPPYQTRTDNRGLWLADVWSELWRPPCGHVLPQKIITETSGLREYIIILFLLQRKVRFICCFFYVLYVFHCQWLVIFITFVNLRQRILICNFKHTNMYTQTNMIHTHTHTHTHTYTSKLKHVHIQIYHEQTHTYTRTRTRGNSV